MDDRRASYLGRFRFNFWFFTAIWSVLALYGMATFLTVHRGAWFFGAVDGCLQVAFDGAVFGALTAAMFALVPFRGPRLPRVYRAVVLIASVVAAFIGGSKATVSQAAPPDQNTRAACAMFVKSIPGGQSRSALTAEYTQMVAFGKRSNDASLRTDVEALQAAVSAANPTGIVGDWRALERDCERLDPKEGPY